jgi:hypothetical protein
MTRRKRIVMIAIAGVVLLGAFVVLRSSAPVNLAAIGERITVLEREAEAAGKAQRGVIDSYAPRVGGDLLRLDAAAVEILRQIPGVADVHTAVTCPKPAHRIIHFRDFHLTPREPFAADLAATLRRPLSREELDLRYRELMLQVELVTLELETVLHCVAKHHGVRALLAEGLTPETMRQFKEMTATLRQQDEELNKLLKARADLKAAAEDVDRALSKVLAEHRRRLLEWGAAGQLAIDQAAAVLPLDDERLLQEANPVRPDGTVKLDLANLDARHDAQVKTALASGPVAAIVLGASHDLSAAVQKLGAGSTEYIRVSTRAVEQFVGSNSHRR